MSDWPFVKGARMMKSLLFLSFFVMTSAAYAEVPEKALTFDFNVKMIRMSRTREEKVHDAIEVLRRIFSSREFKRRILNHRYQGRRTFAQNRGLSNEEIYHKLLDGVERLKPYRNNAMDVELALYTDNRSTVMGYTLPTTRRIWMNTKYFNRYRPSQLAANLTHEWLHKLGFDHDYKRTKKRPFTVPYAIGYIVRDLARHPWKYE